MATDKQVTAFRAGVPDFPVTVVRQAIDVAAEALEQGLPPVQAMAAAAVKVAPEVITLSGHARNLIMVATLNGLIRADHVKTIGPRGIIFPIQRAY